MAKLVSNTYGDALFELALEMNQMDSMLEEVKAVSELLRENEELTKLMNHPKVVKEEKIEVIENAAFWRVLVQDNGDCPEREYTLSSAEASDGHGIGLSNIYDRASGLGGRATIRSSHSGFEVLATIPKKERA